MKRSYGFFFLLAVLLLGVAGCANQPPKNPEQALRERASAYWDARGAGDNVTAYAMESGGLPADGQWLQPHHMTRIGGGMQLSNIQVEEVTVDGDKGVVKVSATVRLLAMSNPKARFRQVITDHWVLIDGTWYHKTQKFKRGMK